MLLHVWISVLKCNYYNSALASPQAGLKYPVP